MLHGSSSVPQEYVKIVNTHGGALKDAVGIPEEQLRKAAKSAVCKINIDSDGRLAMTAAIRKIFVASPPSSTPAISGSGPRRAEETLHAQAARACWVRPAGLIRNISDKETRSFAETGFLSFPRALPETAAPRKRVARARNSGRKATRRHRI